jgi:hypothetical protein
MFERSFLGEVLDSLLKDIYYYKKEEGERGSPCLSPLFVWIQGLGMMFRRIAVLALLVRR